MTTTLIENGTVVDGQGERRLDLICSSESGLITHLFEPGNSKESADETIDAEGCYVTPGMVDLQAHLREPGNEDAETVQTGSRAAAVGGFTGLIAMPNTEPAIDSAAAVAHVIELSRSALCEVRPAAAMTIGREGKRLTPMAELYGLGVRIFTDNGSGLQDDQLMRRALEYASSLDGDEMAPAILAQHCEVMSLAAGGVMNEGYWSTRLGLPGQPNEAEEAMVQRDLLLARLTDGRVHLQNLSTARSVEMVRMAKADGLNVTAEAAPSHFALDESLVESFDPVYKMNPPLRTPEDAAAVRAGLADGTIDAIASAHMPQCSDSKDVTFEEAAPGATGLETALAIAMTHLDLPIASIVQLMSIAPAKIAGMANTQGQQIQEGSTSNLAVIDPQRTWTVDKNLSQSLSRNSPFHGMELRGKVRHTVFRGDPVVVNEELRR